MPLRRRSHPHANAVLYKYANSVTVLLIFDRGILKVRWLQLC